MSQPLLITFYTYSLLNVQVADRSLPNRWCKAIRRLNQVQVEIEPSGGNLSVGRQGSGFDR